MAISAVCSLKSLLILLLISAVPAAYLISLELSPPSTHVFHYHSTGGFLRECAKWDPPAGRFIVSFFEGGVGEVRVPEDYSPGVVLREVQLAKDADVAGNASLGLVVDRPRNRVVVAVADALRNKYSALAAYDLSTWKRLFLTQLSGPEDGKAFADDVAVDAEGNAYVTDVAGNKIWKVGPDGQLLSTITHPLFTPKQWYKTLFGLNGIVYHPDGYLLVIHTFTGNLFKIRLPDVSVVLVHVEGSLAFGDGMELLSPTQLVVAGSSPSARLVESSDGWETAKVVGSFKGPSHRLSTAATVKDGKVYLSHMFGIGYPEKKHAIVEAVFSA
ncbi:unnamed protein product [Linum trigynum]|uniref:Calcium-dependent phosphotriesterase superfamily protein n=2 Tax=Linum trigynum TaxID=586398 RepID=A0AAV2CMZ1_9ROSI